MLRSSGLLCMLSDLHESIPVLAHYCEQFCYNKCETTVKFGHILPLQKDGSLHYEIYASENSNGVGSSLW